MKVIQYDLMALKVPSELLKTECLLSTKFNDQWQGDQDLATIQTSSLEQYICLLVRESRFVHLSQSNLVIFLDYKKTRRLVQGHVMR